jgi:hypothetical protein
MVHLSTIAESLSKITQFAQGLAFCEPDRIGAVVLCCSRISATWCSPTALAAACEDQQRFSEFIHCARAGISALLTLEVPDLFGQHQLTQLGVAHLSDNLVLPHCVRNGLSASPLRFSRRVTALDPGDRCLGHMTGVDDSHR